MARKKLLSKDLEKILDKLNVFADSYDVRETKEFRKLERLLSEWKISCLVEESMTPRGQSVVYNLEEPEELLDFFNSK